MTTHLATTGVRMTEEELARHRRELLGDRPRTVLRRTKRATEWNDLEMAEAHHRIAHGLRLFPPGPGEAG